MITNIGKLLQKERLNQKLTLEDIEKKTKIRKKNLDAIEQENWNQFPSRTYIRGVIKTYGEYLKLDTEKLDAYFRREFEKQDSVEFKNKARKSQFTPQSKKITIIFATIIFSLFLLYFGYQLYEYISPPNLVLTAPQEETIKGKNKITIKGTTEKDVIIKVNEERIYLDDEYNFSADVPLPAVQNRVVIEATGPNGKKTIIEKLFIKEE